MTATEEVAHISAIRGGDEPAFEKVFRQYYAALSRYAIRFIPDPDEAEEVVQQVFMNIWEKRAGLHITVSLKAYLYRSVHNGCLNLKQKKQQESRYRDIQLHVVHTSSQPLPEMQRKELETAVSDALKFLPEQCRKVFELSRFEELKYREIAELMGISVKTVENQMGKALRIMREQLAPFLSFLLFTLTFLS